AAEASKTPLLESRSDKGEADSDREQASGDFMGEEADADAPEDPGADDVIDGGVDDDRPLDVDWTSQALETDSFSDVVTSGGGEDAFDFDRVQYSAASLAEYLIDQLHGASGPVGDLARIIAEALDETGYLTVPIEQIAELTGAPLEKGAAAL